MNISEKRGHPILRVLAAFMLVAVVLSACGKSVDEYIARAQALLDAGLISAKAALRLRTKHSQPALRKIRTP
jgi:hypothetical protein